MAELALAVIPLGITVTSGLVKYLKTFNDHDDDLARLLNPELSISSSEASVCLRECQKVLEELDTLQQKIFATTTSAAATTPHVRTKNKIKGGCKKLIDEEFLTRKILNEQMVEIQKNKIVSSNISTDIKELRQPISEIGSSLPVLQTSVDAIVPHFDQRFDQISYQISYQNVQMQAQIESLLEIAGPTRYQDRLRTNQQLSYSRSGGEGTHLAAREIEQELHTLSKRADSVSTLVDLDVAPAFLVIRYLHDAIELRSINEARSRTILSAAQRKLQELFCSGRASPNDVTEDSLTLLHILGLSTYPWLRTLQRANSPFVRSTCEGLLNFLVAAGTSVTVRNRVGMRELIDYYDQNQSVARKGLWYELVHYGPLGLAVIRNNLPEVERLISLHPHMLKEVSHYGETPLHIAIYRLDILEALAKEANSEVWIQYTDDGATVLNLAIQISHEISAGCPIIPHRDFRQGCQLYVPERSFSEASLHCRTLLAKELHSRRWQLRDLARNKLSITEFSNFTALEEVPDIDAIAMDGLLRQKGILGLGPLSTFVDEDLPKQPCRDVGYYSRSIFFDLGNPEDAELFLDCDFKLICADQHHDFSLDRALFNRFPSWSRSISLDYAIWLFDHQAPLWKWSSRFTSPMPSIFVLADILGIQDYKCPGQDNTKDKGEHYLSKSVLLDNCSCLCSPDGCTPFTSRMKWLAHPYQQAEDLTPQDYATRFGSYVEIYGRSLNLGHHIIMVRQATFAALDLKHTCLDRPGYSRWPGHPHQMYLLDPVTQLEPDEMEFEIFNVDVEAMNQLEEVVVFMQAALDTVAKRWDHKLDGVNDFVQIATCEEAIQETRDNLEEGDDDDEIFNRFIQRIQDI
ncbi:hypothetical protein FOC4_g10002685 [Fusarium odoratissimum]|uniref:Fungal N-terminal domain-containing protein n=1 Tax=Fusarium oxysporum f. sp. cubense (strain race 4) TaxID=2502994 RepID=N1SBW5_FUSC4|nr:hypothetical protein FOC4_g10002685 [Fusarium odoratissimum]